MKDYILKVIKGLKDPVEIKNICKLKDEVWKHGFHKQMNWFEKVVKKKDIHFIIKINKKVVGYLLLRPRTFKYKKDKRIKGKYFLFDSFVVKKNYRGMGLGLKLMNAAKKKILQKNYFSILTSKQKDILFYKKEGWKVSKKIKILDHPDKWPILIFNKKYNKFLDINFYS